MREHIEHLLAALGAVGFALFVSYFNTGPVHVAPLERTTPTLVPISPGAATYAVNTFPSLALSTSTIDQMFPSGTSAPSEKKTKTPAPVATPAPVPVKPAAPVVSVKPKPVPSVATPTVATTTTPPVTSPVLSGLGSAVVNILCTSRTGTTQGLSGSGTIIDSRGVILTVAHVAQAELLEQAYGPETMSCVVRTGSPAHTAYKAKVMYLSENWLRNNSTTLISSHPTGNGSDDFALLAITASATGRPLPSSFPSVPLANIVPNAGNTVQIAGYGAEHLTNTQVFTSLTQTLIQGAVSKVHSFRGGTADALSVDGGDSAQEGASGGAVATSNGALTGVITGSEITSTSSTPLVWAITVDYIRRTFTDATGKDFDSFYQGSIPDLVNSYAPTAQTLGTFLGKAIGLQS